MANSSPAGPDPSSPAQPPRPSRRNRILAASALALAAASAAVLLPLPTLVVRYRVVPHLQHALPGRLAYDDLSAGWFSGITLSNPRLLRPDGSEALAARSLHCALAPFEALRGHYDLGNSTLTGTRFSLAVHPDGSTDLADFCSPGHHPLDLRTHLQAQIAQGTFSLPAGSALTFDSGAATFDIAPGTPTPRDITLHLAGNAGQIALHGDGSKQSLELQAVDLATLTGATLAGKLTGQLTAVRDPAAQTLQGQLDVDDLSAAAKSWHGDTLHLGHVALPVDLRVTGDPQRLEISRLSVISPLGTADLSGAFTPSALASLLQARPAGSDGKLNLKLAIPDLSRLAGQLPHALDLAQGVQVTGGQLAQEFHATWTAASTDFTASARFDVAGQNGSRPITIAPVELSLRGAAKPNAAGVLTPSGLALKLQSGFMSLDCRADSPAAIAATGALDLGKLATQLGQFVDLGPLTAAGTGHFDLHTQAASDGTALKLALTLDSVRVARGTAAALVDEPRLVLNLSARIDPSKPGLLEQLRQPSLHLESRSGTLDAAGQSLAALNATADLDLGKALDQARPFLDLGTVRADGKLHLAASAHGDLSRPSDPIAAKLTAKLENASGQNVPVLESFTGIPASVDASAKLTRGNDGSITRLSDATVNAVLGDPASPDASLAAAGSFDLATRAISLDISHLTTDLARLQKDFPAFIPPARLQAPKGLLSAAGGATWDGQHLTLIRPLELDARDLSLGPVGFSEEGLAVRGETLHASLAGSLAVDGGLETRLSALSIASSSHLLDATLPDGKPFSLTLAHKTVPAVSGSLSLSLDVNRLLRIAQALAGSPPSDPLGSQARADCTLSFARESSGQSVDADLKLQHLSGAAGLSDAPAHLAGHAVLDPFASGLAFSGSIETPLGAATVTNGKYLFRGPDGERTSGWVDALHSADVTATLPDVTGLWNLLASGATPAPISATSGKVAVHASISRQGETTTAQISDLHIDGLALKSAADTLASGDLSASATLAIQTLHHHVDSLRLTDLKASLPLAELAIPEPLEIRDLAMPQPTVTGAVRLAGQVAPAWKVLQAIASPGAPGSLATGRFQLSEKLSTSAGKVAVTGGLVLSDLTVAANDTPLLSEPRVELANELELDAATHTAEAHSLKLTLSSGVLSAQARGRLIDWAAARQLDQVHLDLDYDCTKLWTAAQPLLSPGQRQQWSALKAAGHGQAAVDLRGSLPAGSSPWTMLAFSGSATLPAADLGSYSLRDLVLPFNLQNGLLKTTYADGHSAPPAKFNQGTLDLSEITLDLNGPATRITIPRGKLLLSDVKVDAPLAQDLLARLCPLFAGSRDAVDGKLTLAVVDCTNLDPHELTIPGGSTRGQRLELLVNLADLRLTSALTDVMTPIVDPGTFSSIGTIRDGHVVIQDGQVSDDLTLTLAQGYEIGLKGTIRLQDQALMPLTAIVSKKMLPAARQAGPAAMQNLPDKVEITFDGTTSQPLPRVDSLTRLIQDAAAKAQTPAGAPIAH